MTIFKHDESKMSGNVIPSKEITIMPIDIINDRQYKMPFLPSQKGLSDFFTCQRLHADPALLLYITRLKYLMSESKMKRAVDSLALPRPSAEPR